MRVDSVYVSIFHVYVYVYICKPHTKHAHSRLRVFITWCDHLHACYYFITHTRTCMHSEHRNHAIPNMPHHHSIPFDHMCTIALSQTMYVRTYVHVYAHVYMAVKLGVACQHAREFTPVFWLQLHLWA
jgi:hypothetical protein